MNYLGDTFGKRVWTLAVFFVVCAGTFTAAPGHAAAIEQLSCPSGYTLRQSSASVTNGFVTPILCVNDKAPEDTKQPTSSQVQGCPSGYKETPINSYVNEQGVEVDTPAICLPDNARTGETIPTVCTATSWFLPSNFITCIWRTLLASIGGGLIYLAITLLIIAGSVFNFAISFTILNFSGYIFGNSAVATTIATGWTVFRDLANITIIGMFVFIAISIILGNSTYGDKKLIARVLVVATLINFSFLFTRIIINVSNVMASQIYNSTKVQVGDVPDSRTTADTPDVFTQTAQLGPAGKLITFMGVKGMIDTSKRLVDVSNAAQSGWVALGHGLLAATLIVGAAIVLLYGSLLLITRAVIFILLLVTGALAFATHLIPTISDGEFGWSTWWRSLLHNAVLAPIFMIFLFVTMNMADGISKSDAFKGRGAIGGLADNPTDPYGLPALFSFLLIIGLLYASVKIAAALSSHVAGFATAQKFVGGAAALPFGLAGAAATYGRQRLAYGAIKKLDEEAKGVRRDRSLTFDQRQAKLNKIADKKEKATARSKTDLNFLNTKVGKAATGAIGLSGVAAGQVKVDYGKGVKEAAEKIRDKNQVSALTKDDKEVMRKDAIAAAEGTAGIPKLKESRDQAEANAKKVREEAEVQRGTLESRRAAAQATLTEQKGRQITALENIEKQKTQSFMGLPTSADLKTFADRTEAEKELVKKATEKVEEADKAISDIETSITKAENEQRAAATQHDKAVKAVERRVNEELPQKFKGYEDALKEHVLRSGGIFGNNDVNEAAWKGISGHEKVQQRKEFIAAGKEYDKEVGIGDEKKAAGEEKKSDAKPHDDHKK